MTSSEPPLGTYWQFYYRDQKKSQVDFKNLFLKLKFMLQLCLLVLTDKFGIVMFYPCLFCPSDNVWHSQRADAPRCAQFSTVISPSWITEQISIEKSAHRGVSARRERQTMFKIVTWTKKNMDNSSMRQERSTEHWVSGLTLFRNGGQNVRPQDV